ncbi:MAG: enoyl-CoA hydratase/isomerase family protein [Actinobacteria bacterium]|nr:MAG: enoyl-CoA hydratase/isomerase family protein [Actinomycetota bacterium]
MPIVQTEDRGPVRHVVLDRPEKRNALNGELVQALGVALKAAANDPEVRCVVIRGEGPMFSSGMDFSDLVGLSQAPENLRAFRREILETWNLCEEMAKPTVCQVHGACIGGALELALACDLRVAAEDAMLGLPETRVGLIPDVGGSSRLPAVVGLGRAKELIMCAPIAIGHAKRVMDAAAKPALAATLEQEVTVQELCARSQDYSEGARALAEKRQPEFSGR